MGMGSGSSGGKKRPMADINITPMVDVMLVLLVIFMITAPVIKQMDALEVKLPQLQGQPAQTILTEDARTVVIAADGTVSKPSPTSGDGKYENLTDLIKELKEYKADCDKNQKPPVVVIAGDRAAQWERIMQVQNCVLSAGITQISCQVESNAAEEKPATPRADARP